MSTDGSVRPATDADVNRLLATLLGEQQRLATPVVRASAAYDAHSAESAIRTQHSETPTSAHSAIRIPQSAIHQDLIPLSAPGPGEHYAFQVDLDACSGCKACVAACHSLNGLDETEAWRDVGLLVATDDTPWQQTVTTACHHCSEPGCLEGCPVVAYEKDPVTGIVRHLDDQCIGCSYCILKCPYDVPKFNARLGIVRKCDMCQQRLAVGEAPACVQACPTQAISIIKVPTDTAAPMEVTVSACACGGSCSCNSSNHDAHSCPTDSVTSERDTPATGHRPPATAFLPGAPDPSYTKPTTRYVSTRGLPANVRAADADDLYVQPAHWPLVVMLTLTQLAVGLLATAPLAPLPFPIFRAAPTPADAIQFVTYYATFPSAHLVLLAALALLFAGLGASGLHLGKPLRAWRFFLGLRTSWLSREILAFSSFAPLALAALLWPASLPLRAAVMAAGLLGVFCSAMIYIDTRRRFWRAPSTSLRFFGTGVVAALAALSPVAAAVVLSAKLLLELAQSRGPSISARLQRGPLRPTLLTRFALGLAAIVAFLVAPTSLAFALFAAGELAERVLFFRSVDSSKMPGNPASA